MSEYGHFEGEIKRSQWTGGRVKGGGGRKGSAEDGTEAGA